MGILFLIDKLFSKKNEEEKANFLPAITCKICGKSFRSSPKFSSNGTKMLAVCPNCNNLNVKRL